MILGLDPGIATTGITLLDKGKILKHKTCKGKDALVYIVDLHTIYKYSKAVIEKPKQAVFYAKHMAGPHGIKTQAGVIKLAQNVGMNIQLTENLVDKLKELGVRTREVNPGRGMTKWDVGYWTRIFNWESGRTPSEHARDAAVLALKWENWVGWNLPNVVTAGVKK
jgi:hypothetical protein